MHDVGLLKEHQYAQEGNNNKNKFCALFSPQLLMTSRVTAAVLICTQLFPTGSGKSCLLFAVLAELCPYSVLFISPPCWRLLELDIMGIYRS